MSACRGLLTSLLDDAAIFPPGDLPLEQAVPAHLAHQQAWYGDLVGHFVVAASALQDLARVVAPLRPGSLAVVMTAPAPMLAQALAAAASVPALRVGGVGAGRHVGERGRRPGRQPA